MRAPLIGITTRPRLLPRAPGLDRSQAVAEAYVRAVAEAGGLPVLLPSNLGPEEMIRAASRLDGILLSGGGDVDPRHYGEEPRPGLGTLEPVRDRAEIALIRRLVEEDRPLLGICRGIQILNVALGGGLVQDLPGPETGAPVLHEVRAFEDGPGHEVTVREGTKLLAVTGRASFCVTSSHHQAAGRVAPGLVVSARARDGVVEGLEHPERGFVLGVQWHPERSLAEHPESALLFRALVEASGR